MRFWAVVVAWFFVQPVLALGGGVAVIGDSLAVGSFTHPSFEWDVKRFNRYLNLNESPKLDPALYTWDFRSSVPFEGKLVAPTRFWESIEEHAKPTWEKRAELSARSVFVGGYVDMEEYAWPYLTARARGVRPDQISIAAEAGNRVGDTLRQVNRLLGRLKNRVPEEVFLLFAGNDLCSLSLNEDLQGVRTGWSDRAFEGLSVLIDKGITQESTVFILPPIDPSDLIDSESVLDRKVYAFGQERTCRSFREFDPGTQDESKTLKGLTGIIVKDLLKGDKNLPSPLGLCRSVLSIRKGAPDYADRLANMRRYVKAMQEGAADAVQRVNEYAVLKRSNVRAALLRATERLRLNGQDVANDCFHLSLHGHENLARLLIKELSQ